MAQQQLHHPQVGILPGMYAEPIKSKVRNKKTQFTSHLNLNLNTTPQQKSLSKPPIFDYLSSFLEAPIVPAHLEVQRNLVIKRRGMRRRGIHGKLNSGWFTDADDLVRPPYHTKQNRNDQTTVGKVDTASMSIMQKIVSQHPPLYRTLDEPAALYTNLRHVVGLGLEPLGFPTMS
jgi:hypothetical protein